MGRKRVVVLALAALWSQGAAAAQAAPVAIEVPVSIKLTAPVPASYVLRFELSGADRAVRWAEQMNPAGDGRRVSSPTLNHLLGSLWRTVPGNTALEPALFSEQLWLQALRWSEPRGKWAAASARVRLTVVPYAAWSAVSDAAGEEAITTFMIQDGAVTGEKIQDGAVTFGKLGESCPADKPQLVHGPSGWTCGTALTCSPGDFLMCYEQALFDRLFIGVCRPGYRPCTAEGNGFGPCTGAVLPGSDACNGLDDDCDGIVDNPPEGGGGVRLYEDADGDGRGKDAVTRTFCGADHPGWAPLAGDCDDADPAVFTGAPEVCDSRDNDCDGTIDDGCRLPGLCSGPEQSAIVGCFQQCAGPSPGDVAACAEQCTVSAGLASQCAEAALSFGGCYLQSGCDTEGFDPGCAQSQCNLHYRAVFGRPPDCQYGETRPCGDTPNQGLCHDGTEACRNGLWSGTCDGAVLPVVEICGDGFDQDCDGTADNPNPEICDGLDNDCVGGPDNVVGGVVHCVLPPGPACSAADAAVLDACLQTLPFPEDAFSCFASLSSACQEAVGAGVSRLPDCVIESCFASPEPLTPIDPACFTDAALCKEPYDLLFTGRPGECLHGGAPQQCGPGTGEGICADGTRSCDHGLWGTCVGAVYPAPAETCGNGLDDNCNGQTDEGNPLYLDGDADGVGAGDPVVKCPEEGWVDSAGDCDDANPGVFPGNGEWTCDGVDNDCDAGTPDGPDEDADGYSACPGAGGGDCDDGDPAVNPGALEVCDPDFRDENCDGQANEGCDCFDGEQRECYSGPPGSDWVGECRPGTALCSGGAWGACDGEVLPRSEVCDGIDNDCNGATDDDPALCADGVACTADVCQGPGGCMNIPDDTVCDDGSYCTGRETCDGALGCLPGTPPACNDGNACTLDACDDFLQSCTWTPIEPCP